MSTFWQQHSAVTCSFVSNFVTTVMLFFFFTGELIIQSFGSLGFCVVSPMPLEGAKKSDIVDTRFFIYWIWKSSAGTCSHMKSDILGECGSLNLTVMEYYKEILRDVRYFIPSDSQVWFLYLFLLQRCNCRCHVRFMYLFSSKIQMPLYFYVWFMYLLFCEDVVLYTQVRIMYFFGFFPSFFPKDAMTCILSLGLHTAI